MTTSKNEIDNYNFNSTLKRFESTETECFYCGESEGVENVSNQHYHPLYNEKDRLNLVVFRNVTYDQINIGIARCTSCKKKHKLLKSTESIIIYFLIATAIIVPFYQLFITRISMSKFLLLFVAMLLFLIVYGMFLGKYIHKLFSVERPDSCVASNKLISIFLNHGWSLDKPRA